MTLLLLLLLYAVLLSAALALAGHRSGAAVAGGGVASDEGASPTPTRVLIVGATGGTGRRLVERALALGHEVTAFVRDPPKLGIQHPRLTVAAGDVLDHASVEAAVRGQKAVLSALGHKRFFYPTRVLSEGARNILRAMETQGVPRFVCVTSLGIGDSAGRMGLLYTLIVIPFVLPFYFWDKTRQERTIARSDVEWIVVRPGVLTNAERRGSVRHGRRVGSYLRTVRISRADVADFMLRQLESDTYLRTTVGVSW